MTVPLLWDVGDRCRVFGRTGRIVAWHSDKRMCVVRFDDGGYQAPVPIRDLDLAIRSAAAR